MENKKEKLKRKLMIFYFLHRNQKVLSPATQEPFTNCRDVVSKIYLKKGYSLECVNIIINSLCQKHSITIQFCVGVINIGGNSAKQIKLTHCRNQFPYY
ncbi:unnamed protein product [Parnassius apollo]|uniref:(apollo) hypothetical protein n=1 Tax=Parnassius apollo TaxID=110799 RepID=A0A8S3YHM8_PARAO|nr:unnamed protein product [Parnassius apollo]